MDVQICAGDLKENLNDNEKIYPGPWLLNFHVSALHGNKYHQLLNTFPAGETLQNN